MPDSVPSARYSPVCNVLRLWIIWFIPTYLSVHHGMYNPGSSVVYVGTGTCTNM